jgi:hypothetical protein
MIQETIFDLDGPAPVITLALQMRFMSRQQEKLGCQITGCQAQSIWWSCCQACQLRGEDNHDL